MACHSVRVFLRTVHLYVLYAGVGLGLIAGLSSCEQSHGLSDQQISERLIGRWSGVHIINRSAMMIYGEVTYLPDGTLSGFNLIRERDKSGSLVETSSYQYRGCWYVESGTLYSTVPPENGLPELPCRPTSSAKIEYIDTEYLRYADRGTNGEKIIRYRVDL